MWEWCTRPHIPDCSGLVARLPARLVASERSQPRTRRRRDRTSLVRHNCGVSTQSLRDVRDHFSEVVDRVEHQHDRVVVTRNGHAAAVILSPDDLASLEETIDVLSDEAALADIREADEAYARGDVVRGVDAVRRLRG